MVFEIVCSSQLVACKVGLYVVCLLLKELHNIVYKE